MAFDWGEFLNLARFLQGQRANYTQEAASRSAVSRAYYAAFCYARNYARDRQGFSPTYDSPDHKLVREHFRRRGMTAIAFSLDDLRKWRNGCDYDDTVSGIPLLLTSAINQAQEVINKLT